MGILDDLASGMDKPSNVNPPPSDSAAPPAQAASAAPQSSPQAGTSVLDQLVADMPKTEIASGQGQAEPGWWDTAKDVAKSTAIGIPKGIISAFGTPGDIANLVPSGDAKQATNQDQPIEDVPGVGPVPTSAPPTSKQIQSGVEQVTGPFYEPKTRTGKVAESASSFASNPLSYVGPGGLTAKLISAAAAGTGSEVAGQVAEGYGPAETAARIAGGLIGGHIPGSIASAAGRNAIRNAASSDELFNTSSNLYDRANASGLQIKQQAMARLQSDIVSDLRREGFRPLNQPAAFNTIEELSQSTNNLGNMGLSDIDSVRKALRRVAKTPDASTREAARYAISRIDDYVSRVAQSPQDIAFGHSVAGQATNDLTEARRSYAAAMRSEALDEVATRALDRAGTSGSGANIDNVMRQELRSMLNNRIKRSAFSPGEQDEMRSIIRGDWKQNTYRYLGKFAPTGVVSTGIGLELGHLLFKGVKGMGIPIAGYAFKKMGDARTAGRISDLAGQTRLRGYAGPSPPSTFAQPSGYRIPSIISPLQNRGGRVDSVRDTITRMRRSP